MRDRRVALVTDEPGWHGRVLAEALAARGWGVVNVALSECRLDLGGGRATVILPGFEGRLPAGVFVRGLAGGTLEQVVLRLDILHTLRELGVVVYNDARAIERTVDKAMTSVLLRRAGLPTPDTWVCEAEAQARAIVIAETSRGRALVAKPLFGSQGKGVRLLRSAADLEDTSGFNGAFYLQSYVDKAGDEWWDVRVFVIGGRAVAAMRRSNSHWVTNRARGGRCEPMALDGTLAGLATAAARAVQIDYAGVDLIPLPGGGYTVTEVNSMPAWQGLQSVAPLDIASALAEDFLARLSRAGARHALP